MAEAFRSLSGRDYALGGTLSVILLFVVMNGVGFLSTSPLKVGAITYNAHPYYADVQNSEDQRCETRYGQNAAARKDAHRGGDGQGEAEEKSATLCLARLQLREARAANLIAAEYNAISADAAWWARLSGMLVTVVGLVSVIGIIVALFAASDARRATNASFAMIAQARRTSRAYLEIMWNPDMPGPAKIRNSGSTPAIARSIRVSYPDFDIVSRDPSVMVWHEHNVLDDVIAPASSLACLLPFVPGDRAHGVLVGVLFRDVHNYIWCSWRHFTVDKGTGALQHGRSGEFPCGKVDDHEHNVSMSY